MRSRGTKLTVLALTLGVTLGGCSGSTSVVSEKSNSQPQGLPASTALVAVSVMPLSEKLSDRTIAQLRARGTTLSQASPEGLTEVSVTDAATSATNVFRFTAGKAPTEAQFARVSNSVFSAPAEDGTTADKTAPLMKDRPMWLVVFDGVEVPIHRPETAKGAIDLLPPPATYKTRFVVYIDGITGRYLRASSLSDDLAEGFEPEVSKPLAK